MICREWADFGARNNLAYSDFMLRYQLPVSVPLSTEQILAWLRHVMEHSGFVATTTEPLSRTRFRGQGYDFVKRSNGTNINISARELVGTLPGGQTEILIELEDSRGTMVPFNVVVTNNPLHPNIKGIARQGRLLRQRYSRFRFMLEEILPIRPSAGSRTATTMAEDPILPI
jgi:hypothetical protein